MRTIKSARILLFDAGKKLLLFQIAPKTGHLAGHRIWITPGGGLETDETYEQAAKRELFEETGFAYDVGDVVLQRSLSGRNLQGEEVSSEYNFFLIRADDAHSPPISSANWTDEEHEIVAQYRWWSIDELKESVDEFKPTDIADIAEKYAST